MLLEYESGIIAARLRRSERVLVRDVSFSLDKGESMALIGETGSGKTMTALSIMRLLPNNVEMRGGKIVFRGQSLLDRKQIRELLGVDIVYIPQNGLEFLSPSRKVRHHLYDSLKRLGVRGGDLEEAALKTLQSAGFSRAKEVIDKYPFQLSGGMAQRVTIALAACSRAKLVIADEPTNGLDCAAKAQFLEQLDTLFPESAKLIITHDIAVARLCRRALVLCGGRMMERGPAEPIMEAPHHPYAKALMGALVEHGMHETPVLREQRGECPFYRRCPRAEEGCALARQSRGDTEWWCSQQE